MSGKGQHRLYQGTSRFEMVEWKEIPGYSGYYVSDDGHVWSSRTKSYLSQHISGNYLYVKIETKIGVHRLVALAFHSETYAPGLVVNHKDSNTTNNIASNLEWMTDGENLAHSYLNGRKGKRAVAKYDSAGNLIARYESMNEASGGDRAYEKYIERVCKGGASRDGCVFRYEQVPDIPTIIRGWKIGNYVLSEDGRLFGLHYKKWLSLHILRTGRRIYDIRLDGKRTTKTPEQLLAMVEGAATDIPIHFE